MWLQGNQIWHAGRLREVICQSPFDTNLQHKASLNHKNAMFILDCTSLLSTFKVPACDVSHQSFLCQRDSIQNLCLWTIKAKYITNIEIHFFQYPVLNGGPKKFFFLRFQRKYLFNSTKFTLNLLYWRFCFPLSIYIWLYQFISAPVNSHSKAQVNIFIGLCLI